MTAQQVQRKEYIYNLGGVELKFTLRTDVKLELDAWLKLMAQAKIDVEKDLAALK